MLKKITYLTHKEIDQNAWDKAIDNSYNGNVYAYSFYLNTMANNQWDALVYGNYEAVFPLVFNKKWGINYLYQPYFCQQLGLFAKNKITQSFMEQFIDAIPSKFRYWNFHLNTENTFFNHDILFNNRTNYNLSLNNDYISIFDNYKSDAKKNIAQATLKGFSFSPNHDLKMVADVFFQTYGEHYPNNEKLSVNIIACMQLAIKKNKGFSRAIFDSDGNLWSVGFFFMSHNTIYYTIAAPTEAGKKNAATHLLIDEVIKEFSNKNLTFDFEGSDIKSVAYFYSKFGSERKFYLQITKNNLPFWCKFLKK